MGGNDVGVMAAVGPKVLGNVDRYFVNDMTSITVELLQNARRAGASRVDVTTSVNAETITFADDGCGIPRDKAHLLLSFGGSGNEDVTEGDERPAGMGFFALARRGATIRSGDWEMEVSPRAFLGEEPAVLSQARRRVAGTIVTLPLLAGEKKDGEIGWRVKSAIEAACETQPMRCTMEGEAVAQKPTVARLRDDEGHPLFDDLVEMTIGDCSVVVARFADARRRWENVPHKRDQCADLADGLPETPSEMWRYTRSISRSLAAEEACLSCYADVFGQEIMIPPSILGAELAKLQEDAVLVRKEDGRLAHETAGYLVVVESLGSETLVPRLPDRRELVRTEGLDDVVVAIAYGVARLAARAPRNGIANDAAFRTLAAALGVVIPPCQRRYERPSVIDRWIVDMNEDGMPVGSIPDDVEIVDNGGGTGDVGRTVAVMERPGGFVAHLATLAAVAAPKSGLARRVAFGEAVDDRRVTSVSLVVDDKRYLVAKGDLDELSNGRGSIRKLPFSEKCVLVDSLAVVLETEGSLAIRQDVPFAFCVGELEEAGTILVTRSAKVDDVCREGRKLLDDVYYSGMTPEDRIRDCEEKIRTLVTPVVLGKAGGAADLLERWLLGPGRDVASVTTEVDAKGNRHFRIVMDDGSEAVATIPTRTRGRARRRG